jgi:hypothetical protein
MFENLNNLQKVQFLSALSPDDLQAQIKSIRYPMALLSIYFANGRHVAWFLTDAKIVKKTGKEKPPTDGT